MCLLQKSRRRLTGESTASNLRAALCAGSGMPVSELVFGIDDEFSNDTAIRTDHRTQISRQDCICQRCSARNIVGDLSLHQGKRPNLVYGHLKILRGQAMQKHYTVTTHMADAAQLSVNRIRTTTKQTVVKSSKLVALGISERTRGLFDDVVHINGLMYRKHDANESPFRPAYWASLAVIACVGLGLLVCVAFGLRSEWRSTGVFTSLYAHALST